MYYKSHHMALPNNVQLWAELRSEKYDADIEIFLMSAYDNAVIPMGQQKLKGYTESEAVTKANRLLEIFYRTCMDWINDAKEPKSNG